MNAKQMGPWETSRDAVPDGYVQITVYDEASGNRVATVFESEDYAHLIKAAPNLLYVCREIAATVDGLDMSAELWDDLHAAIAETEGR